MLGSALLNSVSSRASAAGGSEEEKQQVQQLTRKIQEKMEEMKEAQRAAEQENANSGMGVFLESANQSLVYDQLKAFNQSQSLFGLNAVA